MKIAFAIWSICAFFFLGLSLYTKNSKKAVSFWANDKSNVVVENVEQYNRAVSKIWLIYAICFELIGLPILLMKQNSPLFIFVVLGVVFLTIGIMVAYTSIEAKYRK